MLNLTISDYIDAIDGDGGAFRTLDKPVLRRDGYGTPGMIAGNSAVVFPYFDRSGGRRFLKCHTKPNPHLRTIYEYIERRRPALLPRARLLPGELFVDTLDGRSGWVDVVEGEWVEGATLARAISDAARARASQRLGALADAFDRLWGALGRCEWAHGDLKPENIVVCQGGELTLIDCDAMWIPALEGAHAAELGTPPWCDPARDAGVFDKSIDDYPVRIIAAALRRLAADPGTWSGYSQFEERVRAMNAPSAAKCGCGSRDRGSTSGSARG